MAKILSYNQAVARKQPSASAPGPRVNPAEIWINRHKPAPSQSRYVAEQWIGRVALLLRYAEWRQCPWHTLRYEDVEEMRARLHERVLAGECTAGYANSLIGALKGVMVEVWRLGMSLDVEDRYIHADELEAIRQVPRVPGKRLKKPRRKLTDDEMARLIAHCGADDSARGVRDRLLFGLAALCGMRASEYAALQLADYDRAGRRLRIPQIKVEVDEEEIWQPLEEPVIGFMEAWLRVRGTSPGALLTRLERGGMGVIQQMRPDAINDIVKRRAAEIGLEDVTSHDTRRWYVTGVLRHTGDLAMAAKLARHKSTKTTSECYDMRDDEDKREVMKRVPFPTMKKEPPDAE